MFPQLLALWSFVFSWTRFSKAAKNVHAIKGRFNGPSSSCLDGYLSHELQVLQKTLP